MLGEVDSRCGNACAIVSLCSRSSGEPSSVPSITWKGKLVLHSSPSEVHTTVYWCTSPVAASFFRRFFASQNSNNNRIEKADRNDLRLALALRMAPVPSKNYGRNLTSIILSAKKNLRLQAMCTNISVGNAKRILQLGDSKLDVRVGRICWKQRVRCQELRALLDTQIVLSAHNCRSRVNHR